MTAKKKITNAYTKTFDRNGTYVIIERDGKEEILATCKSARAAGEMVTDIKKGFGGLIETLLTNPMYRRTYVNNNTFAYINSAK